MNKKILSIIGGAVLAILTFIGGIYKDEILNYTVGKSEYKYLEGNWNTQWTQDPSPAIPGGMKLKDNHIEVTHVYGRIVYAHGFSDIYGKYELKGKILDSTIVFFYERIPENYNKPPGVVILKLNGNNQNLLEGLWDQTLGEEIVHGNTSWQRLL